MPFSSRSQKYTEAPELTRKGNSKWNIKVKETLQPKTANVANKYMTVSLIKTKITAT